MIKIFFSDVKLKDHGKTIFYDGVINNSRTEICKDIDEADWIFLTDERQLDKKYEKYCNKIIIIDLSDNYSLLYLDKDKDFLYKFYFKGTVVNKNSDWYLNAILDKNTEGIISTGIWPGPSSKLAKYYHNNEELFETINQNVITYNKPIEILSGFAIKNDYMQLDKPLKKIRDIDIAIFFVKNKRTDERNKIAYWVSKMYADKYKIHVGIIGKNRGEGRNKLQKEYTDIMLRSKIVITCTPEHSDLDYRLYEALSCGPLVFVNRLFKKM